MLSESEIITAKYHRCVKKKKIPGRVLKKNPTGKETTGGFFFFVRMATRTIQRNKYQTVRLQNTTATPIHLDRKPPFKPAPCKQKAYYNPPVLKVAISDETDLKFDNVRVHVSVYPRQIDCD